MTNPQAAPSNLDQPGETGGLRLRYVIEDLREAIEDGKIRFNRSHRLHKTRWEPIPECVVKALEKAIFDLGRFVERLEAIEAELRMERRPSCPR